MSALAANLRDWSEGASYDELEDAAVAFDAIEYHAEQLSTYLAQSTIGGKHLASARYHNDKIRGALAGPPLDKPCDISNRLSGMVLTTLTTLEGYTPPETEQDWACVSAAQTIRALCLTLGVDATPQSGAAEGESAVGEAETPKDNPQATGAEA